MASPVNVTTLDYGPEVLQNIKIILNFLSVVYTLSLNMLLVDYLKSKPIVAQTVLDKCHVYWAINRVMLSVLINARESLIILNIRKSTT